jgi:diguanylate cyclase (GGDEF)-like protein
VNMQVEAPAEEVQEHKAQLAELGKRDLLTGLYNRQFFLRMLSAQCQQAREGVAQGLLYMRPDGFGGIDERFGPLGSDAILKSLARVIGDKIGTNAVAARFGGTVFTVFVVRKSFSEIEQLAHELRDAVSGKIFEVGRQSTSMTISLGLTEIASQDDNAVELISMAQKSAQQVREQGGNRILLNKSLEEDDEGRLLDRGWFKKIKTALESNNFQLVYQPIASLDGETSNIYDVLVRMLDDNGEEIMPGDFMPAAERTGLMSEIDRWVIDYAFRVVTQRKKEGKDTLFFLRVSEASLLDEGFEEWIARRFRTRKVPPESVVFQIPEVVAEKHLVAAKSLAALAASLQCGMATGHFGVGEKPEQLLDLIDMDYVIIDGSFMANLNSTTSDERFARIIKKAEQKEVSVIASQVENASDVALLCRLGVHYVQGFYLQEPEDVIVDNILLPE